MAGIFNRLAYLGLGVAAVGGIVQTTLYNGTSMFIRHLSPEYD